MNTTWHGFASSIPGSGHIRRNIPCQDASGVILEKHPAVIVCDGRGSASLSHFGAQNAIRAFRTQCAIFEPFIAGVLDCEESAPEKWTKFCKIMYRTLMQVKLELASEHDCAEKEFDFTVAFAVAGEKYIGCFQVGDGALVVSRNGTTSTVFMPDKGEFANQTHFLRNGGEERNDFQSSLISAEDVDGLSATSDGPEHLMFQLSTMTPGKIFKHLFSDLIDNELNEQDLRDYLTRREWDNDPRGTDDRSIAIIGRTLPVKEEKKSIPSEEVVKEIVSDTVSSTAEETAADETNKATETSQAQNTENGNDSAESPMEENNSSLVAEISSEPLAEEIFAEPALSAEKAAHLPGKTQNTEEASDENGAAKGKEKPCSRRPFLPCAQGKNCIKKRKDELLKNTLLQYGRDVFLILAAGALIFGTVYIHDQNQLLKKHYKEILELKKSQQELLDLIHIMGMKQSEAAKMILFHGS